MFNWLAKFISDSDEKKLTAVTPLIDQINSFESGFKALSDEQLCAKTQVFKQRLASGETLERLLPEAFAAIREASARTIGLRHFDVQLLGGIILHQGRIAEMKTGEGKTLAATLPVYLNALTGQGVHVVTVNDYLAKRDAEWMGPIYQKLGLTVGIIQHWMEPQARRQAYAADITYGTNNEFGFDYLRDNMAVSPEHCVQRQLHYAIVDEVDSILIDEARTPLIISGMVEDTLQGYLKADQIVRKLVLGSDFTVDEKTKNATLSDMGIRKLERLLGLEYLFDVANMDLAHQINQALRAHHCFEKNVDYVVKEGEVLIVDEFTGRLMEGRRYSEGLHQAIEAKERVEIKNESQTLATITFQNYFRLYQKIAGMTGTAKTEEGEFWKIYNLEVVVIPPHMKMVREDLPDVIYKNRRAKYKAVVDEIVKNHKLGRPLLVGTISIENSELLSDMLKRRGVQHQVLNAKQHEREAEIVSQAGQKGRVTISTNMAGRGTDIVLGEGVKDLGGLYVIGTERHESRRIDNQLRGRSGRQGDAGASKFFVSLEDDLMRLFGSQRVSGMMDRLGIEEDTPIEARMISGMIERAQKKVEEYHFGIRKQVLEFDDVMTKQRITIYSLRRQVLDGQDLKKKLLEMMDKVMAGLVNNFLVEKVHPDEWDYAGLISAVNEIVQVQGLEVVKEIADRGEVKRSLFEILKSAYESRESELGPENMRELEKLVMLRVLDQAWIEQLHNMDTLREGIGLRGVGGKDPLVEYKIEGYKMFQEMMQGVHQEIVGMIFKVQLVNQDNIPVSPMRNVTYGVPPKDNAPRQAPVHTAAKVGRNDPCPCGSGKKYKKCCMLKEAN
ncbi:preprotein translocase subunit SecA [Candidatus Saganbacteria bacterium CG08_land_8_20_14_0_20_45_16]|uniref:Protein translocase subunit SecA n=1 Tax=Candidatus Saganbacteria bacterium CG08_land_8_20_14_0_20_45_16 TaxID=2014293 RepID=A0A2H0Y0X1_UNCSA|nr:MAG: preprotein translocase subunit SecA [Candidatus Saganbacteria bacterium CG08_land_8_20_14_0_20_45_16]